MKELILTKDNFKKEVLESDMPVLVDFWGNWCMPCKMFAPIIEQVAKEHGNKVKVCKLNVTDEPELAADYDVMSIPVVMLFDKGKPVKASVGYMSKESLEKEFGL